MIVSWKWMEGQMLTRHWRRVRSVHLIKVKSSGCDRTLSEKWPDARCQSLVNSSKVPERENPDRTCPVSADRTLVRFWLQTGRWTVKRPDSACQRPVNISKGPESSFRDRTRPVSADRMLVSVRSQPNCSVAERTDRSVRSPWLYIHRIAILSRIVT